MRRLNGLGRRTKPLSVGNKTRSAKMVPRFEALEKRYVLDGLVADIHPLNAFEAKLDGQWEGSVIASDGKVYFGSSTHAHDTAGLFFQYDPVTTTVTQVGSNLSAIVGEDPLTQVPQGKLHSPIVEADGWLYFATHVANYWPEALDAYTGSHLIGYQLGSLEAGDPMFQDFGIHRTRFSTYSAVGIDPAGENIWWVATPFAAADEVEGTHLYRTNIATGNMQDFGPIDTGTATDPGNVPGKVVTMHVDARGDAWVTIFGGHDKLFVGRAATGTIETFESALPTMTHPRNPGELSAYQTDSWWYGHSIDSERFIFSMRDSQAPLTDLAGGSLWEFDASKTLDGDLSDAFRQLAWIGGNHGTAYDDGIVYFVRRSDGEQRAQIDAVHPTGEYWDAAADNGVRLHLYSLNLNVPGSGVTDLGMVTDADDRVPWRLTSITADGSSGEVYLVGDWMLDETDPVQWRTQRHDTGPGTTYTEHMRMQALAIVSTDSAVASVPLVEVSASDAFAAEPNNNGELRFTRTGDLSLPLTVHFTVSGTATSGDDYLALGSSVTIAPGQTRVNVPLVVNDDPDLESAETVVVTLVDDVSYDLGAAIADTILIASEDLPPPDPALVGYWRLDETAGNVAADGSGNSYDATLVGDPVWTSGFFDGGLEFDGTGDYVDAGIGPSIIGTGGFSIAAWVRTDSQGGQVIIQQRSPAAYNGEYVLEIQSVGSGNQQQGHVYFWTFGDFAPGPTVLSTNAVNDGQWHHVLGVREDNGTMRIYIDGVLDASAGGAPRTLAPINVYLGADVRNGNKYFDGTLDDVRVYSRALDADDALSLANAGLPAIATDDSYTIGENDTLTVGSPGVLVNDFGQGLIVTKHDAISTAGVSVAVAADGSIQYDPSTLFDSLAAGQTSQDTFSYTISDGIVTDSAEVTITINGVNDPPNVNDDVGSTNEDAAIDIDVLANDADVDQSDTLSVASVDDSATSGTVTVSLDGTIHYDPQGSFDSLVQDATATDTFSYTTSDGNGGVGVGVVTVTITGVNDSPTAVDDNASTDENTSVEINVLQGDSDVDSPVIQVTHLDASTTVGSVTLNPDGTVTYSPNGQFDDLVAGETANDTFQYTIADEFGATSTALVTVVINGLGVGLAAFDDEATTNEQLPVNIAVLDNDVDGGPPAVLSITNVDVTATIGLATLEPDNTITYDPNGMFEAVAAGETTTDRFVYTLIDGLGDSDTATVVVTIEGVNDAPQAVVDAATTDEDSPVLISVLANDTDVDASDTLSVTEIDTTGLLGVATLHLDGTITYDPTTVFDSLAVGDSTSESFTYTLSDEKGGLDTGTVTVTVTGLNESPVAVEDAGSTDEATPIAINVLANDSDVDSVSYTLTSIDDTSVVGNVSFDTDGTITYDPAGQFEHLAVGQTVTETISYIVTDSDGASASSVLVITVDGLNDDPVAADDQYAVVGDRVLTIAATGVLTNDTDVDVPAATGGFYFASPDGAASNVGSFAAPWDLATLFAHPAALQPGDTVYLRGGTYFGAPDAYIEGTEAAPIVVRAYPGEHVRFDLYSPSTYGDDTHIRFYGANVHWVNIEFMSSDPSPRETDIPQTGFPDINRGGLTVWADHNKFINVIAHDLNQGIGFWGEHNGDPVVGGEIYGAIIYNNGWDGPDRQHGHGIYAQNEVGTKRIADTVIFNQYGMGLHAFGTSAASFKNFEIEGNILFNNGAGVGQGYQRERDLLVGGGSAAENILVQDNFTYQNGKDGVIAFGLLGGPDQKDVRILDNYFVGRVGFHSDWEDITFRGNTTYHMDDAIIEVGLPPGVQTSDYDWDQNAYHSILPTPFVFQDTPHTWSNWQSQTGLDANSTFSASKPTGVEVTVRPNEYEAGRGHVVVYNWDLNPSVDVDLSAVLQPGDAYQIHSLVDLFGTPVLTGIYDGNLISLPMAEAIPPSPIGHTGTPPVTIGPEFGAFIVTTSTNAVGALGLAVTAYDSISVLGASVSLNELGGFVYDATSLPVVQSLGPYDQIEDTFTYTVADAHGGFDTATVTVTISGINHSPTAGDDDAATDEETAIVIDVLANDSDIDPADSLAVQSINNAGTLGTVTLNPDNTISYSPVGAFDSLSAGAMANDTFSYTIVDDFGGTDTAVVTVTIVGVNDLPTATDDNAATDEDTAITIDVLANDVDPDASESAILVERVAAGLTNPVFVTGAPGESDLLYIAEQNGDIKVLDLQTGIVASTPFLTITDLSYVDGSVRGILGLTFHPDYATNRLFYVYMTDVNEDSLIRQYQANPGGLTADPTSATAIIGIPQIDKYHYAGWIGFGPHDGMLYIASGDGGPGNDTDLDAQNLSNLRGKILRIDVSGDDFPSNPVANYAISPDNPFAAAGDPGADEIWVYGLRNPWRNSFDRVTGDLYIADVGQNAREELNVLPAGEPGGGNYGWRAHEGTISNPGVTDPDIPGAIDPIYDYLQGFGPNEGYSITGGYVYHGPIEALRGNYFFGDFVSEQIWSLQFNGDPSTTHDGTNFTNFTDWTNLLTPDVGEINLISSFGEDEAGNLYIVDYTGEVFRISAANLADELTVSSIDDSGLKGSVAINSDGTISYNPNGQFESLSVGQTDTDVFAYTMDDGNGGSQTATVTITIAGINDAPVATPKSDTTDEETAITIDVLLSDSDVDQLDVLSLQSIDDTLTIGTVTLGPDDSVSYDPVGHFDHLAAAQTQEDTFTYTIVDNHGTISTATVTVTVIGINDDPLAGDDNVAVSEDASQAVNVLAGDSDPDTADNLTVISVDDTLTIGIVTLHPDGSVVYDPNGQFESLAVGASGVDSFSYTIVDDAGITSTANVTVTINGVNDAPTAVDDNAATQERQAITIDVLDGDSDIDIGDVLTVVSVNAAATVGTVILGVDGTITYDPENKFIHLNSGQTATDTFQYRITDGHGGFATATVTVTINGLDAPPAPVDGLVAHWSLDETGGTTAVDQSGNGHDATVHGNPVWSSGIVDGALDLDASGDYLSAGQGPSIVGTGGFSVAAWVRSSSPSNQIIVQQRSSQQFNGQYVFQLTAAGNARLWTFGGSIYGPIVSSNQKVNDGQWHHVVGVREDNGTTKVYVDGVLDAVKTGSPRPLVPINVYLGADLRGGTSFLNGSLDDVRIYDRALDAQDVDDLFLYRPTVDPGIASDDTYTVDEQSALVVAAPGLLVNDNGASLTVTEIDSTSALGVSISGGADGGFVYSPTAPWDHLAQGETITDSFSYTVSDGALTDVGRVTVNITGVNDDPSANDDTATTDEATAILIEVRDNDSDVDASDELSVTALDLVGTVGDVVVSGDGRISYDPGGGFETLAKNDSATDTFAYTIGDGHGGTATATVTVTINGLNDAPVAVADSAATDEENSIAISVIDGDFDVDAGDQLTVIGLDTSATVGIAILNPDQTVTYDPSGQFDDLVEGQFATDTFVYIIEDGNGATGTAVVTVTISGIGLELVAVDDTESTPESAQVDVSILANDFDGGTPFGLTIDSLDTSSTLGTAVVNPDGTVSYDPNGQFESLGVGQSTTDTFGYTISNGLGDTDSATVTITILGENDSPSASDDAATTDEDSPISIAVLTGDSDPDTADTLFVSNVGIASTIGSVTIEPNGTVTYDPNGQFESLAAGETDFDSFTYTLSDGHGGTATATVVVTILGVDEATVPTEGLLAHWALDEVSGTAVSDDSGNGFVGTLGGDALWSTGKINGGLEFDGSGDHVDVGIGPSVTGTSGFTVATWVRSTANSNQVLVQQRSPQAYNGEYVLHLTTAGNVRFWTFGGAYGPITVSAQAVNDGQWHHVVGVREDNGTTKIYIDGVLDGSKTGAPRPLIPINVYLGADMRGNKDFLNGSLDDVRIYNRPLTAAEVTDLASYQPASASQSLENPTGIVLIASSFNDESSEALPTDDLTIAISASGKSTSFTDSRSQLATPVSLIDDVMEDTEFVDSLAHDLQPLRLLSDTLG